MTDLEMGKAAADRVAAMFREEADGLGNSAAEQAAKEILRLIAKAFEAFAIECDYEE